MEQKDTAEEGDLTQEPSPLASPSAHPRDLEAAQALDPLWSLSKSEALRLCQVYEEEMGVMYPILELPELLDQVHLLYGIKDHTVGDNVLHQEDVYILRLVFACALTAEASGRSEQAIALFDSVREVQDNYVWGPADIKSIIFLALVVRQREAMMRRSTDSFPVNILLPNGRGNAGLADDRNCGAHVPRERTPSPRNAQPTCNSWCWERPSGPVVLVGLHSRHTMEFWDWHALCIGGFGYRPLSSRARGGNALPPSDDSL